MTERPSLGRLVLSQVPLESLARVEHAQRLATVVRFALGRLAAIAPRG